MKLLTEWADFENLQRKAINALRDWYRVNLQWVAGSHHGDVEEVFGLPYTSSGSFAGLWQTNSEWHYRFIPKYRFSGVAIGDDGIIYAVLDAEFTDPDIFIPIGTIKE